MPRLPGLMDIAAYRQVVAEMAPLGLDVLHGHGAKGGAYARLAGRALKTQGAGVKIFYTPHGGTLHFAPGSLEGWFYQSLERGLDRLTDGLIFESAFAARVYALRIGAGKATRRVIHNGLTPADFTDHKPEPHATDIVFVGELRDLKGIDVLLRALAYLNVRRPQPLRAAIVGSGPDKAKFERLAQDLGLASTVVFTGARPAAEAFALGRILCVPSRKESFPYIVLEAAAAGLPLIATDAGGICEIVEGTDTTLIPPDDVPALAAAITEVTAAPVLAHARAQRLKAAILERFTIKGMTDDILQFYRDAGADKGPPATPA